MRINDRQRECVSQVRTGKFCAYGFETFQACVSAGLLTYEDNGPTSLPTSYSVTPAGAKEADAYEQKRAKQKARANRGSKIRRQIYKDMGMSSRGE
jgi:hypothetical protein